MVDSEKPVEEIIELEREALEQAAAMSHFGRWSMPLAVLVVLLLGTITMSLLITTQRVSETGTHAYDKQSLDTKVRSAIATGGDLGTIRHIFASKKLMKQGSFRDMILGRWGTDSLEHYEYNVTLEKVMMDIKAWCYISQDSLLDTHLVARIDTLLAEHTELNPFEKLEPQQRQLFGTIRRVLDSSYPTVSDDVNRICDELHNRNLVASKYLADAQDSYRLSYWALLISGLSFFVGGLSMIFGWRRTKSLDPLIDAARQGKLRIDAAKSEADDQEDGSASPPPD